MLDYYSAADLEVDQRKIGAMLERLWFSGHVAITRTEYMEYYLLLYKACTGMKSRKFRKNSVGTLQWLSPVHNMIATFAASSVDYIRSALGEMPDDFHILETCANINQDSKKRWQRINNICRPLNRQWINSQRSSGNNNVSEIADLFARQWAASALPCLRERMDRIAWGVRSGYYNKWKVNGPEWHMIKKFYAGLELNITLTKLGFREMFLCMRPVEFSMAQTRKLDEFVKSSKGVDKSIATPIDRVNENTSPSRKDCDTQVWGALIPAVIRHWSLVVCGAGGSMMWELEAVNGDIAVRQREIGSATPPDGLLVGYTHLTNEEISTNAQAIEAYMGKDYGLLTRNCQLLFALLYESTRTPLTINDLFTGLADLPSSLAVDTARRRCRELATTELTPFAQPLSTFVSHLPLRLGTLYLCMLTAVTAAIMAYTCIVVSVWLSVLISLYAMLWGVYAKGYYGPYLRMAIRLSEQDEYRFLYETVYGSVGDNYVREIIARRRVPSRILQ